jgi:hypothetical protein
VYGNIRNERIQAKKNKDDLAAKTFKLSLNGAFGHMIYKYSWLYDPKAGVSITVNGQLFICMLSERLSDHGIRVISLNTDGVVALVKSGQRKEYEEVCKQWEEETGVSLEYTRYRKLIRRDVNSYIAILEDGSTKEKNIFLQDVEIGKQYNKPIVAKALYQYFVNNVPVRDTIDNEKSIFPFCMSEKSDPKFTIEWRGEKQQRTNRYYACHSGAYLYKTDMYRGKRRYQHMLKDSPVQLLNNYTPKDISKFEINYDFYERETREVIQVIEPIQLKMLI